MIIKKLVLNNFGVYAGRNVFEFTNKKPIVLIGGMNGRGKTTFLEAILLALYGANSVAFKESWYNTYGKYLRAHVNKNDSDHTAFVELEFLVNEGTVENYVVHREWNADGKRVSDRIEVKRNGKHSDFLTENWAMFIENLLPSALSSFYFFDGEKIADMAVDETNAQMKESIRSMLGISVLDVLQNDLNKGIRKAARNVQKGREEGDYHRLRAEYEQLKADCGEIDTALEKLQQEMTDCDEKIKELNHQYEIKGGRAAAQREKLEGKKSELTAEIEQNKACLIEVASGQLPLAMVQDLIAQIKAEAQDERSDLVMKQALEQIDSLLVKYRTKHPEQSDASTAFVAYLKKTAVSSQEETLYEISNHALDQLDALLTTMLQESKAEAVEYLKQEKNLAKQLEEVESYLSLDIDESEIAEIYARLQEEKKKKDRLTEEIKVTGKEKEEKDKEAARKGVEMRQALEAYLDNEKLVNDGDRIIKYSNLALRILEEYSVALQAKKAVVLGKTITDCYKKLASKKSLIQEIVMDPRTLDIHYYGENNTLVEQSSLSAGEKQLMVISILWALAICSKKKLPVIIDTPLSRLDSVHRAALVNIYFPQASEQTIILSTDSEINRQYYEMMKESIGDEFTLNYSEETKSTSILKGYFPEQ